MEDRKTHTETQTTQRSRNGVSFLKERKPANNYSIIFVRTKTKMKLDIKAFVAEQHDPLGRTRSNGGNSRVTRCN